VLRMASSEAGFGARGGQAMRIKFTVFGDPMPWSRARTGHGHHYVKDEETEYRNRIIAAAKLVGVPFFTGPLLMDLDVYLSTEKITYWKRGSGDRDNYLKLVGDALQGIAYEDDACIVGGLPRKLPDDGKGPRIEVTLDGTVGERPPLKLKKKRGRAKLKALPSYYRSPKP
jgi:Holliday junction resolvase RusA-like endonuclease